MATKYKDCNGENISYGDILRWLDAPPRDKYSPKEPFFMLCKIHGETMMYCSLGDEYLPLTDCKTKTDKIEEFSRFEIFAHRLIYEGVNNAK